jgi:hypothetical protein
MVAGDTLSRWAASAIDTTKGSDAGIETSFLAVLCTVGLGWFAQPHAREGKGSTLFRHEGRVAVSYEFTAEE